MGPLLLSHVSSTAFGQLQVRGVTFVEALGWQPRRLIRGVAQSGVTSGDGQRRPGGWSSGVCLPREDGPTGLVWCLALPSWWPWFEFLLRHHVAERC